MKWHTDLKVSSSEAKIIENFANYFLANQSQQQVIYSAKMHVKDYKKAQVS